MSGLVLCIDTTGRGICLYSELIDLQSIGRLDVQRASTVEFNIATQQWEVRLEADPGAIAFSHQSREACIDWERETINERL